MTTDPVLAGDSRRPAMPRMLDPHRTASLGSTLPEAMLPLEALVPERPLLLSASLALLLVSATCGTQEESSGPRSAILILLDTLRADHLSSYGYEVPTSPALDALAAEGVRFEQVVSAAPWTLPSVGALLAGREPEQVFDDEWQLQSSLVEAFAEAGIVTAAFTEGAFVSRHFAMDRGFDHFVEQEGAFQAVLNGKRLGEPATGGEPIGGIENTFRAARAWLREHRDERFLLLVHTYEVHTPYLRTFFTEDDGGRVGKSLDIPTLTSLRSGELVFSADERDHVRALYDGGVRAADAEVGRLLEFLDELGLAETTVVAVTSDHGEELGDHFPRHSFDHGHSLRDDQLLVPLILRDPTTAPARRVVPQQVRSIDVLPTLADLLQVPLDDDLAGRSLVPLMTGAEHADRLAVSSQTHFGPPRIAIRDGRYKYILTLGDAERPIVPPVPHVQLYDLLQDPGEHHNLAEERPRLARTMAAALRKWRRRLGKASGRQDPRAVGPAHLERLKSLGYLR